MLRKSSRLFFRLFMVSALILGVSAAYLIHQEQGTLAQLIHPEENPRSTQIFSRWLTLRPTSGVSWDRVKAWLDAVGYRSIPGEPTQVGDYHAVFPTLTVFCRPFHYPDKDFPAQLVVMHFAGKGLDRIEAISGHADLPEWRLEPKRLAEWSTGSKTARVSVRVSELPPYVPRSILAMEDKRFFQHGAFDSVGITRALWVDLSHGQLRQGASTISQQLARSIFLDVRRTWHRKILEAALALYLELRFSKPQLLEMYLNQVYWGQEGSESLIGIEAVSQSLFGKPASKLTVGESATLAGMLQSPNRYSPRGSPQVAADRRKIVLGLMKDQGIITAQQYQTSLAEKMTVISSKKSNDSAYFLAALHDQLSERYSLPALLNEGWSVFTTLDPLLQHTAVSVLKPSVGQASLVAIDPTSGAIRAYVGGTNFQTSPFDRASDAKRQPGSAFKPFVVLAALESHKATSITMLEDKPITLKRESGTWKPQNYDHHYRGKATAWDSLVYSLNVPMVRLAMMVGLSPIVDVARRAGIESPLREDLSLALGTSEVSLLELTGAYATFASGGLRQAPYNIEAILGPDNEIKESYAPSPVKVFDPQPVFLLTQMMQAVLEVGTGKASKELGLTFAAAGKTGTSENFQDAWFVGFTPSLVAGVWVGFDLPKSLGHSAAGIALPIWTAFMKKAIQLDPPPAFIEPTDIVWKTIDPASGLLVKSGCPQRQKVAFLTGTEPTQDCPLHPGGVVGFWKRLTHKN